MRDFHLPGRSAVFATNGICATSHPLAAKTAINTLEEGGNAVDGALAAAFILGICEPQMTGIGGDCFALLKPAGSEQVLALNGSGRAPAGLDAAILRAAGHGEMPLRDAKSVTIPGAVDAFCKLSQDWGKLELAQVLNPAIHAAEDGVPVASRTAYDWEIARREGFLSGTAKDLYLKNGQAPKPGDLFRAPWQANAMRRIAKVGRAGFYQGEVAEDMVASLRALGGSHTLEDFAATSCFYTQPISGMYKGTDLVEHPPNGQGTTAILLANILAHFDLAGLDPFGATRAHLEAEAAKLAYDARDQFLADADYTTRLAHMLAPQTASDLAELIDPKRALSNPGKSAENTHKDTVYLTVVDRDRMAVSLIYSVYHSFGSGLASDKFGILLQNRGAGFTLEKGHPNEAAGGKRPMHTIIPAMLKEAGKVIMPFGVMGGAYQPTGHVRVLSNMVDFGLSPQSSIDAPRCFADGGVLRIERGYSDNVLTKLEAMGHQIQVPETPLGGAQAIRIDHERGVMEGASDGRKDGCAIGY
ncbi:MAG: gamma-glutamyltransferase family protein [Rhodobacteraceae bacterium]|nr:gamma-glutamyltransferase family protein [Paracoccaceae bacterium]